jgi:hypothetical protein
MKRVPRSRYQCQYCGQVYQREDPYLAHRCQEMIRADEIQTPLGQAAWSFYQKWLKGQRKVCPDITTFMTSRFYRTFMTFAEFTRKVGMPDVDTYIWLMNRLDMTPMLWCRNETYVNYIEFLDRQASPMDRAKTTIDTLFRIAEAAEVDVEEVFNILTTGELIGLLQQRRLSPWLLLKCPKFWQKVQQCSQEEIQIIESIIRPDYWRKKFSTMPEMNEKMKAMAVELNL